MTKPAWLFLILTLSTGILGLNTSSTDWQALCLGACAVFATALAIAVIVGRRFKFDPILR
ncbi:hypothetical protein GCM10009091_47430 [Pseudomonas brenneri]|uniref:Uncharacterized protein n=1 Tax=Pseudomonas brenneri TaxID=129817 RepID=A0A5B2UPJ4_9PSED|nr:PA3371 family protein [Pseudomonas brenneri]KAA2227775.1 hypothetical protein F1720_21350 [Pseudomonas brenneri]TWR79979.1 hypothetical protein FJD34_06765 [Pseudomonas brenneri]GGL60375.1 hypothetical protein GCM10009091_47430 [Pseudomonas brenneri]SDV01383.1 hypothetical protein SAMN04490181_3044 [Pseudomonas brenneri]